MNFVINFVLQLIGPYVKQYWPVILGAIILAIASYIGYLKITIYSLEHTISTQKNELFIREQNEARLMRGLEAVNVSLNTISATMEQTNKQFDVLTDTVNTSSSQLKKKMDKFLLTDTKPVDCQSTIKYLIDAKPEYQKEVIK